MKVKFIELLLAIVFSGLVAYGISLIVADSDKTIFVATSFLLTLIPACGVLGITLTSPRMTINLKISSVLILIITFIIDASCTYFRMSESWFLLINGFLLFTNLLAFYTISSLKD